MREPFSRAGRPSRIHERDACGLLLDVAHSSRIVSLTLASFGPTIVTRFGATVVVRSHVSCGSLLQFGRDFQYALD